ncbi:MAG TPA: lysophospholipid acyltransferase family protein [Caulobacteraceae bacterium]|nr:lysophospholipid acyltransferase family protein [Caulobacteraceae bacterium]
MKRFFRLAGVQSTLAFLLAGYLNLVTATMRWRMEASADVAAELAKPEGGMIFFWHGRIALGAVSRQLMRGRPMRAMISLSADGQFIAKAAARLGFPAIRGSTARRGGVGKGGTAAFMEALRFIEGGGGVFITPDGPRGPAEVMQAGPVVLAARAGTRVFLAGLAARPVIKMGSWDKTRVPLPFGRGFVAVDGPLFAPEHADRPALEQVRADWQGRLRGLEERAEALLNGAA